jgi:hypothetical protein
MGRGLSSGSVEGYLHSGSVPAAGAAPTRSRASQPAQPTAGTGCCRGFLRRRCLLAEGEPSFAPAISEPKWLLFLRELR